ncbi:MAG TPA: cupin domain-containing protein [Burkholderiales bacterium]|nr:cupin domain-containing protein [Burkholderiales bacterium]
MARPIRRVITGHDAKGKAIVVSDAPAPFMHANAINPEWNSTDIWRTDGMPVVVRAQHGETTEGPRRQMPTKNGTVLRINNFPPETDAVNNMDVAAARKAFAALGNEKASTFGRGGRHPLMHRTETIDYAIILEGEIDMLLDDEDVHLKAGDIVIQCGTNHAWVNRSKAACRVAFILIDGKFDDELGGHFNQP